MRERVIVEWRDGDVEAFDSREEAADALVEDHCNGSPCDVEVFIEGANGNRRELRLEWSLELTDVLD